MKVRHQEGRAGRVYFPLTGYCGWCACHEKGPRHTDQSFASRDASARRLTRRQHNQLCVKIQINNLTCFEETIFMVACARQHQARVHGIRVVQCSMCGEV